MHLVLSHKSHVIPTQPPEQNGVNILFNLSYITHTFKIIPSKLINVHHCYKIKKFSPVSILTNQICFINILLPVLIILELSIMKYFSMKH